MHWKESDSMPEMKECDLLGSSSLHSPPSTRCAPLSLRLKVTRGVCVEIDATWQQTRGSSTFEGQTIQKPQSYDYDARNVLVSV